MRKISLSAAGTSLRDNRSTCDPLCLIRELRNKGVIIWIDGGKLHYRAPQGTLTEADLNALRESRNSVKEMLEEEFQGAVSDSSGVKTAGVSLWPLAFSQLAHWNLYQLEHKPSTCVISAATRIIGHLDVRLLVRSIEYVIARHDALRVRIVLHGEPMQQVNVDPHVIVKTEDWGRIPEHTRAGVLDRAAFDSSHLNVTMDPLIKVRLLHFEPHDHALIVQMEHIISDGRSMEIFHREMFSAYKQGANGSAFSLPSVPVQFTSYAARQQRLRPTLSETSHSRVLGHFSGCGRVRFPSLSDSARGNPGMGIVHFKISRSLYSDLCHWSKARKTTPVLGALSAYIALALRWCSVDDMVVLFQTDGRSFEKLGPSIGYYAFPLYLRARISCTDSFQDLLESTMREYCNAYAHADFSFLDSRDSHPEFTRNCCFNWLAQEEVEEEYQQQGDQVNACTPDFVAIDPQERTSLGDFVRDAEPMLGVYAKKKDLRGSIGYMEHQMSRKSAERLAENYLMFLGVMVQNFQGPVKKIPLI